MARQLLGLCLLLSWSLNAHAQETFDVVTYTPPAGWVREELPGAAVTYTRKDNRNGTWGRIAVYKSAAGSGNLQSDFSAEWDALVAKPFKTGQPSRTTESTSQNGWRVKAGLVQFTFDQAPAAASLTTMSNGDRKMSIVVLLNSDVHQKDVDRFMASMQFAPIASRARARRSARIASMP